MFFSVLVPHWVMGCEDDIILKVLVTEISKSNKMKIH
jgi:hypothetical protein